MPFIDLRSSNVFVESEYFRTLIIFLESGSFYMNFHHGINSLCLHESGMQLGEKL